MLGLVVCLIAVAEPELFDALIHSALRWPIAGMIAIELANNLALIWGKKTVRWE
jgi:hypothetical protein